jgi:hypothetical protein
MKTDQEAGSGGVSDREVVAEMEVTMTKVKVTERSDGGNEGQQYNSQQK